MVRRLYIKRHKHVKDIGRRVICVGAVVVVWLWWWSSWFGARAKGKRGMLSVNLQKRKSVNV
ncbi:hypothetical protein [Bartonella rattaustraliani]|uniref:hypothetical protein n=1 Tax=Bartonella rattaustraliani TaxID=481139 RepID=UPI0012EA0C56|nr:hypothetical protein [Bartonella rattaustraliani]